MTDRLAAPTRARARRWIAWALVPTTLTLVAVACSDSDDGESGTTTTAAGGSSVTTVATTAAGITEEEALAIAREHQETEDPDFDFESTRPVVIVDGDAYDVSFPLANPEGPGGEPHVVVDATTGEIVDTYRTR